MARQLKGKITIHGKFDQWASWGCIKILLHARNAGAAARFQPLEKLLPWHNKKNKT
jgi:hypothetical protein